MTCGLIPILGAKHSYQKKRTKKKKNGLWLVYLQLALYFFVHLFSTKIEKKKKEEKKKKRSRAVLRHCKVSWIIFLKAAFIMLLQIIFRDFKSSNILLDDKWNAKLSDFGLARLGPSDGLSHVSTVVRIDHITCLLVNPKLYCLTTSSQNLSKYCRYKDAYTSFTNSVSTR